MGGLETATLAGINSNFYNSSKDNPLFPGADRLSVEWYKKTIKRLQAKMEEKGLNGLLMSDRWNILYLSGYFHSSTERPCSLWIPTKGEPTLFVPGLDRDLVATWWIKDHEIYFDFPHAEGDFDKPEKRVDLLQWMLKGLDRRDYGGGTIGVEKEPGLKLLKRMKEALPKAKFVDAGDIPLNMRMVKTPEEIALIRRAMLYHDKVLEFCRKFVFENGTKITDFDVRHEAVKYGTELLMKDIEHTGLPHSAVGIRVSVGCRTGVGTAYPHPNQFFHTKIKKGDAIQFSGGIRIGGYGGEGYRACHIEPLSPLAKKIWEVHTQMTLYQADETKAGAVCSDVARRTLDIARKAGLEKYIYHRPAHGIGMEGHQAPYIALGDYTVMKEGMVFSNEPGLYNPEDGFGYNHGNTVVVRPNKGGRLNQTPLTKEWCWLKI